MIKAHLARKSSFTKQDCSHVLVAHALQYHPSETCEDGKDIRGRVRAACFAGLVDVVSHAPLCETKAQHTTRSVVWLQLVVVATVGLITEWIVFPLPSIKIARTYK